TTPGPCTNDPVHGPEVLRGNGFCTSETLLTARPPMVSYTDCSNLFGAPADHFRGGSMGTRLESKTAIVTGAAGALGGAVARRFATEAVRSLILADLDPDALSPLHEEVSTAGITVESARLDVTDGDRFDELVAGTAETFGTVDILVNTAGIVSPNARIHNLSTDDWQRSLSVNLTGTFHGIRAVARALRKRAPVSIVNIASVSGLTAWSH